MAPGKDPDGVRPALRLSPGRPAPLLLAGPTASGKSAVALVLAETLGGEIVTVDSMQVYRGLDIGTAKPSAADRARIPHHLLDLVEPHAAFDAARWLEYLGCGYIVHHIGYDERRGIAARGRRMPSPLDQLKKVVQAVHIPVQAVGGLSLEQAIQCPAYGAPLVVLGAPLTIDADAFKTADGDLESSLRLICSAVHAYGDINDKQKNIFALNI